MVLSSSVECHCCYQVKDGSLQKKSYSLLEKLLSCSSPSLEQFLQDYVTDIQQLMIEGTSCVKPAAKRVMCILLSIAMTTCHYS